MKKNILLIVFTLFFNSVNSQELNGYIEYSLNIGDDSSLSKEGLADYFKQAQDNSIYVSFVLEFNKNEMSFYSKSLDIDGINTSFSKAFSGVNGFYYKKINENIVSNFIDDQILGKIIIKKNNKVNWKLHNEIKKIENFICYKATATIKYNNGVGNFQKEIIAWYCPNIPYSYGPKGYGGLPGMILEFQENNIVIGAKKIVFNNEKKIVEPKGKIITEKEYDELLQKHFESEQK